MKATKSRIAIAFAAVYLIWGSTYLAIRFAIETLPPLLMAGVRFFIAGIILYAIARFRSQEIVKAIHWRSGVIIGGLMLLGGNGSVVWAQQYVPSGLASLFISTVPLWMVLFNWVSFSKTKPNIGVFSGIALGIAGIWLLIAPRDGIFEIHLIGTTVLIFAAVSWSIGSLYSRRAPLPSSPLLATSLEMIAGGIWLCVAGVLRNEISAIDISAFSLRSVLAFVYLIFIGSIIGFTAYIWLLKVVSPASASTYAFVNPVVAIFLGWILGHEVLTGKMILAAAMIILAVAVIIFNQKERITEASV